MPNLLQFRTRPGFVAPLIGASLSFIVVAAPATAQSLLGRSPNFGQEWGAPTRHTAFIFSHRFEFISGGDQLLNLPTLTLGVPLPYRLTAGVDYASNSEVALARLGGNEAQFWLTGSVVRRERAGLAATAAYNTAAGSADGALTGDVSAGPLTLLAAGRWFSDVFDTGEAGGGMSAGIVARLTPRLALSGDYGRLLRPDSVDGVWSAGLALLIPGSRHSVSIHASNGGATTLQGTLRPRVLGSEDVRFGFTFTAPLGSRAGWARVFRGGEPLARGDAGPPSAAAAAAAGTNPTAAADSVVITMADLAFAPAEVRVPAGTRVIWVNRDEVVHTVTATDGSWGSNLIPAGERFIHQFTAPGRYPYHCLPHPQMRGVIIVE